MGNIASKLADTVFVTSDNPRSENPEAIIAAVVSEMKAGYVIDADRAHAIHAAIQAAKSGDIVLVAGKGHENYQEISGVKQPFDDALIAQVALKQYQAKSSSGAAI
jgi:UDP-N-acetylmuramyl tripeptide synthase